MIASNSVILAERPALVRSPIVYGWRRTLAHPAYRVPDAFPNIKNGPRSRTCAVFSSELRKIGFRRTAPVGAFNFEELTASLKRYPDTNRGFYWKLITDS